MGVTCSTRDRGCSSLIHRVPLNLHEKQGWLLDGNKPQPLMSCSKSYFCVRMLSSMGRPMSLFPRSKSGSKYSSGVMAVGFVAVAYSRVRS